MFSIKSSNAERFQDLRSHVFYEKKVDISFDISCFNSLDCSVEERSDCVKCSARRRYVRFRVDADGGR